MRLVKPYIKVIARPEVDWPQVERFMQEIGGMAWYERMMDDSSAHDGESLVEFGGRECYRSWDEGLNPNVTQVRTDSEQYLENILKSRHGSVLAHAHYSFILHNVSRVFTHEIVRHAQGTDFSQESMRYVRLTDIPMWFPDWAHEDPALIARLTQWVTRTEELQAWMTDYFGLDDTKTCPRCGGIGLDPTATHPSGPACSVCKGEKVVPAVNFTEKKKKTSFMRRFSPQGVATGMLFTANIRALRWIIEQRTDEGAEEEIRIIADVIGKCMEVECPTLFGDFSHPGDGVWTPKYSKV